MTLLLIIIGLKLKMDRTGQVFGRLTVLSELNRLCRCLCTCGNTITIRDVNLGKHTNSCGCLKKELLHNLRYQGNKGTPTYESWRGMRERCNNSNNKAYKWYGGRGIKYTKTWDKFSEFKKDMGERPTNTTLDRIDNNGNYCKENCRWTDAITQHTNTRISKFITFKDKTLNIKGWSKELGIKYSTLVSRIRKWPIELALVKYD